MHWKRKFLVYRIRLDASDCITFAMQILWCHSKLKLKTMDGWLTKVHSNRFIVVERTTNACGSGGWQCWFYQLNVYLLWTLRQRKVTRISRTEKFHRLFPRKAFLSSPRNQFFDLFPVFIRKKNKNLQVSRIATKDDHEGNMFNFHLRIFLRKRRIFSFPRNQACVWKVALASSEKWSVFCCSLGVCTHLVSRKRIVTKQEHKSTGIQLVIGKFNWDTLRPLFKVNVSWKIEIFGLNKRPEIFFSRFLLIVVWNLNFKLWSKKPIF